MKHKKTVTAAVLHANRGNAQSSTGPQTEQGKSHSRHNALRHSILARKVVLNEDEEKEYHRVWQSWKEHYHPVGKLERFFVEEITNISWKLQIALGLESRELSIRQGGVRDQIDGVFHGDLKLPISEWDLPVDQGWECDRIIVRAVAGKEESNSNASRGPTVFQDQILRDLQKSQKHDSQKAHHVEVEAVIASSLDKLTRYQSALKRDLYRAIDMLRVLQTERREPEGRDS